MNLKTWACLFDLHIPFHHEAALDFTFELLKMQPLEGLILGGDFLDFYNVNGHGPLNPRLRNQDLGYEIEIGQRILRKIERTFPKVKKVFIEGNHENRLERYIIKNCPDIFNFINIRDLLRIEQDWKYLFAGPNQLYRLPGSNLFIRHEPLKMGIHAAKNTADHAKTNLCFGHTHRMQSETSVNIQGELFKTFSPGWLGDLNKSPDVFSYVKNIQNWSLGFVIVQVDIDSGMFFENIIEIKETPKGLISNFCGGIFEKNINNNTGN